MSGYYRASDSDGEPTIWRRERPPTPLMRRCENPDAFDLLVEQLWPGEPEPPQLTDEATTEGRYREWLAEHEGPEHRVQVSRASAHCWGCGQTIGRPKAYQAAWPQMPL